MSVTNLNTMLKKLFLLAGVLLATTSLFAQEDLEPLGPGVNTNDGGECYPCISPDGRTLFFSRKGSGTQDYDIMYSTQDKDGKWSKAKFIKELNNSKKNVVYNISPDGNSMLLYGTYDPPSSDGLSITFKTDKGWSKPMPIRWEDENDIDWGNNAVTFSSNRKTLIISLGADLHVSHWDDKKERWSFPIKLPDNVNTSSYEYTPFLASDDRTLYFSSGGHKTLGGNDIVKTVRQGDGWDSWSDPENLGEPVNSSGWESFFAISAKGDYAYVYSLKQGNGDLFRIKLREEQKPDPVVLVRGKVLNSKTKESIGATIVYEDLTTGENIGQASTDPETGEYKIVLAYGKSYAFLAGAEGFLPVSENIDLGSVAEYQEIERDLLLVPIEKEMKVRLNNVFFDVAKATLRPESYPELNRLADILKKSPNLKIEIGGHTDSDGSDSYNLTLSGDRAKAVREYIVAQGVSASQISSKGYGETKPVATNDTEEGKQQNRRVEFSILEH